ncbi:membrane protein [Anaerocolumna cellulosilytica]|uniref:Putative manganese efflux pump MntP n=1 Tax=Anaerocolumna cellulosilytica TaxID=433286 RepID=A0A6S6R1Z5_9FIRM|nr:manganese efflux pump MntP family protein [Anaerocolumna cellulosilytica]MBB5197289.1 putative Mn2+ efflux pump MntP [Anaerocolumna cellulosilytica]BCJ94097.1 membrane protein [Anaerocolumna cellulosilytica]
MSLFELFILAVGLSMDAFAVAVCKGLSLKKITVKHPVTVGLYFGIFQAGMPLIGFILGSQFSSRISSIDHWIAFILLGAIGINMIREALRKQEEECSKVEQDTALSFNNMIVLALATSIDALAIGITFAFLKVSIIPAVSFIGVVTFIISAAGVFIGNFFGAKYKSKAEFSGGVILVCLGFKILIEHLEIFS